MGPVFSVILTYARYGPDDLSYEILSRPPVRGVWPSTPPHGVHS